MGTANLTELTVLDSCALFTVLLLLIYYITKLCFNIKFNLLTFIWEIQISSNN